MLSARAYLTDLVMQGQLSPDDALNFDANLLQDTYAMLEAEEKALMEANSAMQRKVLELEVSNRLLVQRTEAMISFQEIGQALTMSNSLMELAARICRTTRDLCGADRSVVYYQRSEAQLELLASLGWDEAQKESYIQSVELPDTLDSSDLRPYFHLPPGFSLPNDAQPKIRAGYLVPLSADGRLVGRMVLQTTNKNGFSPGELTMLKALANQAALAIQRAGLIDQLREKINQLEAAQAELVMKERMERELELARQVQQSVLPRQFPRIAGVEIAVRSLPARQVGGDFYDVILLDEHRFGVVIADVSDKGMPAALYMALARSLFLAEGHREPSPAAVVANVNRLLQELGEPGMFVTAFYGVIDTRDLTMRYARAGHDRPVVLRGLEPLTLGGSGVALGVVEAQEFSVSEEILQLASGDSLVLYSDGLVDALSPADQRFGLPALMTLWSRLGPLGAEETCYLTMAALDAFQAGTEQSDDMTLLVVHFS
ncbi:MAG: SpoIIE family protein phosphatase [Anaerolineae bacterium]|nr:SpoIIE family protein phosphatase [Anaerolineae bacterium]